MAIPATAVLWPESMDPSDVLDFAVDCTALLENSETITSYTVNPGAESVLLGLQLANPTLSGSIIYMWLSLSNVNDTAFSGGALLPIEISISTSRNRKWQRTAVVRVAQK